ncbi:MAG: DUF4810 domain-containing protein [Alphaproteobacteria bacterium]|nr:MAG: DUF4810 domain-containing protein [Alphaproteobacteria bacterium]
MIRRIVAVAALATSLGVTACAPASLFEWGTYEQSLYAYSENPENREVYQLSLEQAIERGRSRNAVAPGLLAELGYLHMEAGEKAEAVKCFEEERERFPESAPLMNRVIASLTGSAATAGASN